MYKSQSNSIFSRILETSLAVDDRLNNQDRPGYRLSEFHRLGEIFESFSTDNDVSSFLEDTKSSEKTVISLNLHGSDSDALAFGLLYSERLVVTLPKLRFDNHWESDEGIDQPYWEGFKEFSSFCLKHKDLVESGLLLPIPNSVHFYDNNNQRAFDSTPEQSTREVSDLTVSAKELTRPIASLQATSLCSLPFTSIMHSSQEPYQYILELREKHKKSFDSYTKAIKTLYKSSSEKDAVTKLKQIDENAQEISAAVSKHIRERRFKGADIAGNVLVASLLFQADLPYAHFLSVAFSGGNLGSKLLDMIKMDIEFRETVKQNPYYYAYAGHKHLASRIQNSVK